MSTPPEPLDPRIATSLARRSAYPEEADAPQDPRHVQTHLSHVYLTRSRVYKLRKAVQFSFVDFGTRAARDQDCVREIALNRRLAPDVYLGLAPVLSVGDALRVGAVGEAPVRRGPAGEPVLEHCVVMRRLPDGTDALSLLGRDALHPEQLERLADQIAHFHAGHRLSPLPDAEAWRQHVEAPVLDNLRVLREPELDPEDRDRVERIEGRAREVLRQLGARLEARRARGLAVDGHGDLHLQHVWFPDASGPAVVVDCIEFREAFRQLDPASEVAFLAMDLVYRHRSDLAERFLSAYASQSDDYDLYGVVDYFLSYRAAVRAKVAELAARDPEVPEDQRARSRESLSRHLALAERALAAPATGHVVLVTGMVGSGKTTVAHALADLLHAPVLSSDRVRKRLAGLDPLDRSGQTWGAGIYDEAMSDATYAGLEQRAEPILASGRNVVLDATYASQKRRDALRTWAAARALTPLLIEVRCDPARVRARLEERRARDDDASDAGPEHYADSALRYEPPDEWPEASRATVHTDQDEWRQVIRTALSRVGWIPPKGDDS